MTGLIVLIAQSSSVPTRTCGNITGACALSVVPAWSWFLRIPKVVVEIPMDAYIA